MSINEVSAVSTINDYVIENLNKETKEAAKNVESLFTQNFYNGGDSSASSISTEVQKLESYISQKQNEYDMTYSFIKLTNEELNNLNKELENNILELTQKAEEDERKQRIFIQRAIDETNEMYMNGEIEKNEMSSVLSNKIANYCEINPAILNASSNLNFKKNKISTLTDKIASLIDKANCIETESKLAQGTLVMMKNLMSKMSIGASNSATAANERPVYTPTKQALVDELALNIKGLTAEGDYDVCSINNPQVAKLKEFLGLNGNGAINENGILADSALNRMKDAGFTEKEAVYAINWIFDKSYMNYEVGGTWSVPYGHGAEAHETYSTLLDQVDKLWGAQGQQLNDDSATSAPTVGEQPTTTGETPAVVETKRTDPIGYSIGDTTYEFVIDRNNDGKFNGKGEFLGAKDGIQELKNLDKNGDGKVDEDEFNSQEGLFVLITNHRTGEHSFSSALNAGFSSIDLNSMSSKNKTNINNNVLQNTFTVNLANGQTTQGYQTNDSDYYISKSYNGAVDAEMQVTIDEEALRKAQNIFDSIKLESADGAEAIKAKATKNVLDTQKEINQVSNEMSSNAQSADSKLNKVERPETKEERLEREEKEAEEAKKAKEAEEKEEEDKKNKENEVK